MTQSVESGIECYSVLCARTCYEVLLIATVAVYHKAGENKNKNTGRVAKWGERWLLRKE